MENEKSTQLIFFKDLLFAALYQWKKALIAGLAFAILFGAWGVLSQDKSVSVGGLTITPEIQDKVASLEKRQQWLDLLIANQTEYLENTHTLNIDPYNVYTSGFYLYAQPQYDAESVSQAQEAGDVSSLLYSYQSHLLSSQTVEAAAEALSLTTQDVLSMLAVSINSQKLLSCQVTAGSAEQAQVLAEFAAAAVSSHTAALNQSVTAHSISITTCQTGPLYSSSIADQQTAARKKLTDYESERTSIETELKKYAPTELTPSNTNPLIYAMIGGVLGVCLVAGFAWLAHLGSSKIYSARVLQGRTGVCILGRASSGKKRCVVDRWLRKLEGRSASTDWSVTAANIRNRCDGITSLMVMGVFQPEALAPLTEKLALSGIRCTVCTDPAEKPDALEALPGCDGVVLAQLCGSARYEDVEWAMQIVSDHRKPLLGCVLIDG